MEQFQKEKEELDKGCRECKRKLAECQRKLKELEVAEAEGGRAEVARLQAEAQQLRNEERGWESKLEELKKKEKNMPWNVDTLSKDGFSKVGFQVFFWFLGGCFRSVPPPPQFSGVDSGSGNVARPRRASSTSSRRRRRRRRSRRRRSTKASWRDTRSRSNTSVSPRALGGVPGPWGGPWSREGGQNQKKKHDFFLILPI